MSKEPKICLNMIVKNEEKVILTLLKSVAPFIDYYCICDTGSEDNTKEVITTFFKEKKIPGEVFSCLFKNFEYNRNVALEKSLKIKQIDYILLMDADMELKSHDNLTPSLFKKSINGSEVIYILQGTHDFHYKNVRIVKKHPKLKYHGVTHEFLETGNLKSKKIFSFHQLFILDHGNGGCKTNKFPRDIALLKEGIQNDPENARYYFYLANSYKDNGDFNLAIETYLLRIKKEGWIEEVYYSYYAIGLCFVALKNIGQAISFFLEAYQVFPDRIESLYQIIYLYRLQGKYVLANAFYKIAKPIQEKNKDKIFLFKENDIYQYKLDFEHTVHAYYCNVHDSIYKLAMYLLNKPILPVAIKQTLLQNYRYYSKQIHEYNNNKVSGLIEACKSSVKEFQGFYSSTPSLCKMDANHYGLCVRYVNYKINEDGSYDVGDQIVTKNLFSVIEKENNKYVIKNQTFLDYNSDMDCVYAGLEDVRLLPLNSTSLFFSSNRGFENQIKVEMGFIDVSAPSLKQSTIMRYQQETDVEKNWVGFLKDEKLHLVYSWYPLVIGQKEDQMLIPTFKQNTPGFLEHMRGSCHGIEMGSEIWFLCHQVVQQEKRYYYHCFVVLNKSNFHYKRHSVLFTFEGSPIEYCLGVVFEEKTKDFLFSYSKNDGCSKFISVSRSHLNDLFQ